MSWSSGPRGSSAPRAGSQNQTASFHSKQVRAFSLIYISVQWSFLCVESFSVQWWRCVWSERSWRRPKNSDFLKQKIYYVNREAGLSGRGIGPNDTFCLHCDALLQFQHRRRQRRGCGVGAGRRLRHNFESQGAQVDFQTTPDLRVHAHCW